MKKTLAALMAFLLLLSALTFAACEKDGGSKKNDDNDSKTSEKNDASSDDSGAAAAEPVSAEELLEKIRTSMEGLKSFSLHAKADVSVEGKGESVTMANEITAYADLENKRVSAVGLFKSEGESAEFALYLDPEVCMIDDGDEKYMGQMNNDSLGELMGGSNLSFEGGFEIFSEVTMEKENGGYLLKVKGLKDIESVLGLLGDSLGESFESIDAEILSFLSEALEGGVELTLHADSRFYLTSVEFGMSMTVDMEQLMEKILGGMDFDFGSEDFDFDFSSEDFDFSSEDFDFDFDFSSEDFDFSSEDFDFDFDFSSEDFDFKLGEITVTVQASLALSDFNAAADKIVKPSADGYEEVEFDDILDMDMSTLLFLP